MKRFFAIMLMSGLAAGIGCTGVPKPKPNNTARSTNLEESSSEPPASVSRLLPDEITAENYKSKVEQFELELSRDGQEKRRPASQK